MSAAIQMLTGSADIAARIAFLSTPAAYPDHPPSVEVRETHFAWVFLAGARAYKLKKPSHLRGADWRTTEAGAVLLEGATAWFECSVAQQSRAGDHDVVVLRVHDLEGDHSVSPLVFHASRFRELLSET